MSPVPPQLGMHAHVPSLLLLSLCPAQPMLCSPASISSLVSMAAWPPSCSSSSLIWVGPKGWSLGWGQTGPQPWLLTHLLHGTEQKLQKVSRILAWGLPYLSAFCLGREPHRYGADQAMADAFERLGENFSPGGKCQTVLQCRDKQQPLGRT